MPELTLGSLNLHMGRGPGGHAAPLYDVVTAAKEVDTDVLVLQEAWVPDAGEGQVIDIATAGGYAVAATFSVARAECHDQVRLVGRSGTAGDGDWVVAVLSRLPVLEADVAPIGPQLPRDPGRRALVRATVAVGGAPFTVCGTHLPLLKDPVW
ncbi:MAG TPA: endonuclease/exonuclease/phosphatase family protein, partial [Acidimicrobiales bacterium]